MNLCYEAVKKGKRTARTGEPHELRVQPILVAPEPIAIA